jgi:hypothetical protein
LKDSNENIEKYLKSEIAFPSFYSDISDLQGLELIQGTIVVNPAHYDRYE